MSIFILENVKKSFSVNKKEHVVLSDVNITFPDTGLVSIIGKSGSGKSTLLNLLSGIEKPTQGKIFFKSRNIAKFKDKQFSRFHLSGVSTIYQHYNLFDELTAFENVLLPLKMKGIRTTKAKQKAHEYFVSLGIESLEKRIVRNLSGGEKQRVAIIRALVTSPNVILCDEPTGALDSQNSKEIMGILKKISKNHLVIMVSHNKLLVSEFSDYVIELKDGHIIKNPFILEKCDNIRYKTKNKYSSSWISLFLRKNLKKNIGKNIFSTFACTIGFTALLLCIGFLFGSEKSQEEALTHNLSIGNATVSKVESVNITDSHLTYQKNVKPELEEVDWEFSDFTTIRIEENISYLISSLATCTYKDITISNFQMVPVYDFTLKSYGSELLSSGRGGSGENFEEVIVNEEFIDLIGEDILNKNIVIKNVASTNYKTYHEETPFVKDQLIIEKPMKIVGIIKEFPFLNTPKIYYSYKGGKDFLKGEFMENLSYYFGFPYTYYDYLLNCESDDVVSSYSSYIFLTDLSESSRFFKKIKKIENSSLEITSSVAEIKDTYITFVSSFSKTLLLFSVIAFIGINFILGMISLSSFLQNRKNTAIMTCLGGRNSSIYSLYLSENYIVIALSFLISIFLSIFLQGLLNPLISKKFALSGLISIPFQTFFGIKFGLIIILILAMLLVSTFFTLVPMLFYRHGFISEELRDE